MKIEIAIVIGRFQVPKLTEGHRFLIDNAIKNSDECVIFIGRTSIPNNRNPLSFASIKSMMTEEYPNAIIIPIFDNPNDIEWSKDLDRTIRLLFPFENITIFSGRDGFKDKYFGCFKVKKIKGMKCVSGTDSRLKVGKEIIHSEDFRKGIIWKSQNQYKFVDMAIDVAVIIDNFVVVGKKNGYSKYSFCGGFVDIKDKTLEEAGIREVKEEFNLKIKNLKYICSASIPDYRFDGVNEKILSSFFIACIDKKELENLKFNEEFKEITKLKIVKKNVEFIHEGHKQFFKELLKKGVING